MPNVTDSVEVRRAHCRLSSQLPADNAIQMSQQRNSREGKSWPELKGKTYAEAEEYLKENHPDLNVVKTLQGSGVTMDLRMDRVRVIVDSGDKVVEVPRTG